MHGCQRWRWCAMRLGHVSLRPGVSKGATAGWKPSSYHTQATLLRMDWLEINEADLVERGVQWAQWAGRLRRTSRCMVQAQRQGESGDTSFIG
jgi:hypothetical protein